MINEEITALVGLQNKVSHQLEERIIEACNNKGFDIQNWHSNEIRQRCHTYTFNGFEGKTLRIDTTDVCRYVDPNIDDFIDNIKEGNPTKITMSFKFKEL